MTGKPIWVDKFNTALKAWKNTDPQSSQAPCFLATKDAEGRPRVRTVGHAEMKWSPEYFYYAFILGTDSRSPKAEHIKRDGNVEICYWFNETKEQFRIAGKAFIVDSESSDALWLNERRRFFDTLKRARRANYARVNGPGTPMNEQVPQSPIDGGSQRGSEDVTALSHYALIVIQATEVDWTSQTLARRVRWTFDESFQGADSSINGKDDGSGEDEEPSQWRQEELLI